MILAYAVQLACELGLQPEKVHHLELSVNWNADQVWLLAEAVLDKPWA